MSKPFRIMKGDPVDPKHLRYPLYVFPKFNGFRGYVKDGVVYTASNKPFKNRLLQETFKVANCHDGEFVVGAQKLGQTVRRHAVGQHISEDLLPGIGD